MISRSLVKIATILYISLITLMAFTASIKAGQYYDSSQALAFGNGAWLKFSKGITFDDPVYQAFDGKIHLGSGWIASTKDLTLSAWQENNWINYTVSSVGTQQVYNGSKPSHCWIDGVDCIEGAGWTYSSSIVTITGATSTVNMDFAEEVTPPPPDTTGSGGPSGHSPLLKFYVVDAQGMPASHCLIRIYTSDKGVFSGSFATQADGYTSARQVEKGNYTYDAELNSVVVQGNFTHQKDETVNVDFGSLGSGDSHASMQKIGIAVLIIIIGVVAVLALAGKKRF